MKSDALKYSKTEFHRKIGALRTVTDETRRLLKLRRAVSSVD